MEQIDAPGESDSGQGISSIVAQQMVLSAVREGCAGCSTANFAPWRLGEAVAKERISEETAAAYARRLNNCAGVLVEAGVQMCRLPVK
jgi:hypothetical protein